MKEALSYSQAKVRLGSYMQTLSAHCYMRWSTNISHDTAFALHFVIGQGNVLVIHVKYAKWLWHMMSAIKQRGLILVRTFSISAAS